MILFLLTLFFYTLLFFYIFNVFVFLHFLNILFTFSSVFPYKPIPHFQKNSADLYFRPRPPGSAPRFPPGWECSIGMGVLVMAVLCSYVNSVHLYPFRETTFFQSKVPFEFLKNFHQNVNFVVPLHKKK